MPTVSSQPSSVNATPAAAHVFEDSHFDARNKALKARSVVTALSDALIALPEGTIPEHLQALAVLCDRICQESVAAADLALAATNPTA